MRSILSTSLLIAAATANPLLASRDDTCCPNFKGATIAIIGVTGPYHPFDANEWAWHVEQNGQWPPAYVIKNIASGKVVTQAAGGSYFLDDPAPSGPISAQLFAISCATCDPNADSGPERAIATRCTIAPQSKDGFCTTAVGENYAVAEPCNGSNNQQFTFATFN
ncbi:hypothetical protein V5O48_004523 [Marasmius crinis-equi]|uniref:Ricin B lectin domain-containing protein n=1 Tax=Marasmius crinis-equi TaxID=585013 RepID=A0ABR3FPU0_9AGAR